MATDKMPSGVLPDTGASKGKKEKIRKLCLGLVLVGLIIYVIVDYSVPSLGNVNIVLSDFLAWVEDNPIEGVFAFACVYMFCTVAFIPGSLLTLGAGLVFGRALGIGRGVALGSFAVILGASIGAIIAFILGRYVLQDTAQVLFNKFKIMRAVDKAIESQGLKLCLLLRLSPVVPFNAFNYIMGLTAISLKDYTIGCLGIIPGTVAYVFIGSSASGIGDMKGNDEEQNDNTKDADGEESSSDNDTVFLIVIIVGAIATVIAVFLISWYAKKALNRILNEVELEENQDGKDLENCEGKLDEKKSNKDNVEPSKS
uniref:VTT domain-containing protein n=1 Tax=Fibrocapsa japonica TaxID=94617 RepID=A0A7S2Y1P9_9STRA